MFTWQAVRLAHSHASVCSFAEASTELRPGDQAVLLGEPQPPASLPSVRGGQPVLRQTALTETECLGTLGTMDESRKPQTGINRRKRLVERAEQMVKSGRLTDQEAERLRSAAEPAEFDDAIRSIRVRHAGARLGPAVADGSLTREEADGFLDRLSVARQRDGTTLR